MKNGETLEALLLADVHWGGPDPDALARELGEVLLPRLRARLPELDLVAVLGDYFHRKLTLNERASRLAIEFIDELVQLCYAHGTALRFIRGTRSHDLDQLECFRHLETSSDFRIISTAQEEDVAGCSVLWVPEEYVVDAVEHYAPLVGELTEECKYDIIMLHGTFDVAAFPGQIQESERPLRGAPVFNLAEWSEYCFGQICAGHIHSRQAYKKKLYYSGSYTRWCHGEPEPKGFAELSYSPSSGRGSVRFMENHLAPEFRTVRLEDIAGDDPTPEEAGRALLEAAASCPNIRVVLPPGADPAVAAVLREACSDLGGATVDASAAVRARTAEQDDHTFDFILRREMPIAETVQRYIALTSGRDVPLGTVRAVIAGKGG